jgi:aarF domain-containing kinase
VNLPGHICAVVVTTLVLEGWSSKLDPNHSTLQEVQRIVDNEKNVLFKRAATRVQLALQEELPLTTQLAWQ